MSNPPVDSLNRVTYLRKTFLVQAVEITHENMEEVARHIGTVRTDTDRGRYIEIDEKIVPRFKRAYAGGWVTFVGEQIRVYTRRSFHSHFIAFDPDEFVREPAIDIWSILESEGD